MKNVTTDTDLLGILLGVNVLWLYEDDRIDSDGVWSNLASRFPQ